MHYLQKKFQNSKVEDDANGVFMPSSFYFLLILLFSLQCTYLSKYMKILFIGDTFSKGGRRMVTEKLPQIREEHAPDIVILNAENLAGGVATTEQTLQEMENAGVDFFTGGNHSFHQKEVFETERRNMIRPSNMKKGAPGKGYEIIEKNGERIGVINLLGQVFMKLPILCPFEETERILEEWKDETLDGIFVDFHAETTSEKAAYFHHFKDRVTAVIGTHTHVPTADAKIWPNGSFFQTDVGMTGPVESIIGLEIESGIQNFLSPVGKKTFKAATGPCVLRAAFLDISHKKTHNYKEIILFEDE